jgi:hypothetical protein
MIVGLIIGIVSNGEFSKEIILMGVLTAAVIGWSIWALHKMFVSPTKEKESIQHLEANSYRVYRETLFVPTSNKGVATPDRWHIQRGDKDYLLLNAPRFDEHTAPEIDIEISDDTARIISKSEWYDKVILAQFILCLFLPIISYIMYKNGLRNDIGKIDISIPVMGFVSLAGLWMLKRVVTQNDSYSKFLRVIYYLWWIIGFLSMVCSILSNIQYLR